MSYGVEIYEENGNVKLSSEDQTIRFVYSFSVSMQSSGTEVVEDFDNTKGFVTLQLSEFSQKEIDFSFDNSSKIFSYDINAETSGTAVFSFYNVV